MTKRADKSTPDLPTDMADSDPFLLATKGLPTERTPVWFMRQAGRSLPEYRGIRGTGSILEVIKNPHLVTEITLQPVLRYGVDAAVLYSDIMVPLMASGVEVDIIPGRGPVIATPFRSASQLATLNPLRMQERATYVSEAVGLLRSELKVPLIGFAGAPFTVASYLIEGAPSKTYENTKAMMLSEEGLWHELMTHLSDLAIAFIALQVRAGAQAVQLFDSWAGSLSPSQYERYVKPHSARVFATLAKMGLPLVHFAVGASHLVEHMSDMEIDVLGIDWRTPIPLALDRASRNVSIQGNLDPVACLLPWASLETEAKSVLRSSSAASGYVFNLGHGVLPNTDPGNLSALVDLVHESGTELRIQGEIPPTDPSL